MSERFNEPFNEQQKEVLRLLKLLNDNNVLEHVVLVGSWSEYVYAMGGILPGFSANLRTIDLDFLIKNQRRPTVPIDIPALIKSENYSIAHDVIFGTTKFFSPGGLEVEFLIPKRGAGSETVLKTNLGVNAQSLWHMSAVIDNTITADVFGMKVQVPCPEIYVLTKMIINDVRPAAKQEKDARSVQKLLPYLNYEKLDLLFDNLTKKEKDRVRAFIEKNGKMTLELPLKTRMEFSAFISKNMPEGKELSDKLSIDAR